MTLAAAPVWLAPPATLYTATTAPLQIELPTTRLDLDSQAGAVLLPGAHAQPLAQAGADPRSIRLGAVEAQLLPPPDARPLGAAQAQLTLAPLPATPEGFGVAGFEATYLGATEQRSDGTHESTERKWFRMPVDIGDDVHVHTAFMGLASDWTGLGSRPLNMTFDDMNRFDVASLDHALWFHRAPNVHEWHLIDLHSLVNFGGRGTIRATIRDTEGRVVASMAQELLLR